MPTALAESDLFPAEDTPPTIEIVKVWSDQFEGVFANYLPGGAGLRGNQGFYNYILAGVREDDKAWVRALVRITPDTPAAREKLLVRLAPFDPSGPEVPVGEGGLTGNILPTLPKPYPLEVSMWVESPDSPDQEYAVVAWFDTDGDGMLDPGEVDAQSSSHFRFVNRSAYDLSRTVLSAQQGIGVILSLRRELWELAVGIAGLDLGKDQGLKHAPEFLNAFLSLSSTPEGARAEVALLSYTDEDCHDEVMCLDHNVGVLFDTEGTGEVFRFVFAHDSKLAHNIRRSTKWLELLSTELRASAPEVEQWLSNPPEGSSPHATYTFKTRHVKRQLDFKPEVVEEGTSKISWLKAMFADGNELDLWLTFGKVNVDVEITGTVRRGGGQLVSLEISGTVEDLYDWDYVFDFDQARVQAGYRSFFGVDSGRVFKSLVHLDCTYHDLDYTYGPVPPSELGRESACSIAIPVEHADTEQARSTLPIIGEEFLPGADLKSLVEEMIQGGVDNVLETNDAGGSWQIAGSAVLAFSQYHEYSLPNSLIDGEQTFWAGAKRWRPVLFVNVDPAVVADSRSATLVMGGVAALEGTGGPGPPDDDLLREIRGYAKGGGAEATGVLPYEIGIYALALQADGDPSLGGDLFDEGVLVGKFRTDDISSRDTLRVEIDVDVLRTVSQGSAGNIAFVVRGFEDLDSLLKDTIVREEVFDWGDQCCREGSSYRLRVIEESLGRLRVFLFRKEYSSFLILELADPEVAGGGLVAPGLLEGVEEPDDAIDIITEGPST